MNEPLENRESRLGRITHVAQEVLFAILLALLATHAGLALLGKVLIAVERAAR